MRTSSLLLIFGLLAASSVVFGQDLAAVHSSTSSNQEFVSSNRRETVYRGSGRREILAFPGSDRLVNQS
jgi:hypothetical protein